MSTFAAKSDPTPLVTVEETGSSGGVVASSSPTSSVACGSMMVVCVKSDTSVPMVAGSAVLSLP